MIPTRRKPAGTIFGSTVLIIALLIAAKSVALLKNMVVAYRFGTSGELDAFVAAWVACAFFCYVISASFERSFIPAYLKVKLSLSEPAVRRLYSESLAWMAVGSGALALLVAWKVRAALAVFAPGFEGKQLDLTISLMVWLSPTLAMAGVRSVWTSVLNAEERFSVPALSLAITPLLTVMALLVAGNGTKLMAMTIATLAGYAVETAFAGATLRRKGFMLLPSSAGFSPDTRRVFSQLAPMMGGVLIFCASPVIDQSMASLLPVGSVSALNYGGTLVGALVALVDSSLGTAIFPRLARLAGENDRPELKRTTLASIGVAAAATVPFMLVILFFSPLIIRLMFQRGLFSAADMALVSRVQIYWCLEIPFYVAASILTRLLSSLGGNFETMVIAAVSFAANVALNFLFMRWLGLPGIALSTSVVSVITMICCAYGARVLLSREPETRKSAAETAPLNF